MLGSPGNGRNACQTLIAWNTNVGSQREEEQPMLLLNGHSVALMRYWLPVFGIVGQVHHRTLIGVARSLCVLDDPYLVGPYPFPVDVHSQPWPLRHRHVPALVDRV
jgi:hypothetical protein